jgi:drug/metabolite transporter (DMT)-like permease
MSSPAARAPGLADYGLLLTLATIWGSSFLLIKIGVADLPPLTLTTLRLFAATLLMLLLAAFARQTIRADARTWALILLTGLVGNAIPFLLITWGQQRIDSGLAAILMGVMPLVTYVLAHLFTADETLNGWKAAGVLIGLGGIVVLIGPDKLMTLGGEAVRQLAVAAAATCYGINALLVRKLAGQPPMAMITVFMLVSLIVVAPFSLALDTPWMLAPRPIPLAAVILLGVLQTALATVLMLAIIQRQGASFFSQINFLVPLIGVAWGMLILSERPAVNALAALAMVLAGLALARRGIGSARPQPKAQPGEHP